MSLGGLVEVAWCLSRIPSNYYGAPWNLARLWVPHQPAAPPAEHLLMGRQANAEAPTDEAPAEALAEAPTLLQRRVPWGGKKIDWAPPKLGFIVELRSLLPMGDFRLGL